MKTTAKNQLLLGGTILLLAAKSTLGQDATAATTNLSADYKACELSVDGFGTASLGEYTIDHLSGARVSHDTRLGGGLGVNYFFTQYVGVGAEAYTENNSDSWVNSASANLLLRLPLGQSGFAPYLLAGGGHHFADVSNWFVQAGAGMEYRFNPNVGVFVDARGVLPNRTEFSGLARLGVRFAF